MNPRCLRYDDTGSKNVTSSNPSHEVIETSNTSVIHADDCQQVSQKSSDDNDHRSLKLFDFCQIFTEPGNSNAVTIIKDSVSEESLSHNEVVEGETQSSNRYKYCREVIKPYLKNSKECSEEDIVNDAISTAQEDFPDYQPCNEIYFGALDDNNGKFYKGNPGKKSPCNPINNQPENAIPPKPPCLSKENVSSKEPDQSKGKSFEVKAQGLPCTKSKEPCCDPKKPRPKETVIRSCKPKKKDGKKTCPSLDVVEKKSCDCNPNEKAIAVRPDGYKPRYYLADKCNLCRPCTTKCKNNQVAQDAAASKGCKSDDSLPERMKRTVGDILGKLCNGAKDTVARFTKDKNKYDVHEKGKRDKPCACNKEKNKVHTNSCESVLNYNKVRAYDTIEKDDEDDMSVVEQICSKVESLNASLSCLREAKNKSLEKLEDMYKNSSFFRDDSSLYDESTREESGKIFSKTSPNNMFTLIKSKIFGFFNDTRYTNNNVRDSTDDERSNESLPPTEVSQYRYKSDDSLIRRCIE